MLTYKLNWNVHILSRVPRTGQTLYVDWNNGLFHVLYLVNTSIILTYKLNWIWISGQCLISSQFICGWIQTNRGRVLDSPAGLTAGFRESREGLPLARRIPHTRRRTELWPSISPAGCTRRRTTNQIIYIYNQIINPIKMNLLFSAGLCSRLCCVWSLCRLCWANPHFFYRQVKEEVR